MFGMYEFLDHECIKQKEYKIKYISELTEYSTSRRMSWNQALAGKIKLAKNRDRKE
jgi:hypothetical protein